MSKKYGIKVYPLYTGHMWNEASYHIANYTRATPANPHAQHVLFHNPTTSFLIDHPEVGYIMYDTGLADDPYSYWPDFVQEGTGVEKPEGSKMTEQLALIGVKPEEIKYVVTSHMHPDHIGTDYLFAKTAEFYVSAVEAQRAYFHVLGYSDADYKKRTYYIKDEVLQERKQVHYLYQDEPNLFPGIDAYIFPGHTPGVISLYVHMDGDQDLFLLEDACASQANWDGAPSGAGNYDPLGDKRSVERMHRIVKAAKMNDGRDVLPLFGHDDEQFQKMKKAPEFYA